jgi:hypothetical protein
MAVVVCIFGMINSNEFYVVLTLISSYQYVAISITEVAVVAFVAVVVDDDEVVVVVVVVVADVVVVGMYYYYYYYKVIMYRFGV